MANEDVLPWEWRLERCRVRALLDALVSRWWQKYPRSRGVIGPSITYVTPSATRAEPAPLDGGPDALGRPGHGVPGWQDRLGLLVRMRTYIVIPIAGRPRRTWGEEYRSDRVPTVHRIMHIRRRHTELDGTPGPMGPVFRRPEEPTDDRPLVSDYLRDFSILLATKRYYQELGQMASEQQRLLAQAARGLKSRTGCITLADVIADYAHTSSVGPVLQSSVIEGYLRPWVAKVGRPQVRTGVAP